MVHQILGLLKALEGNDEVKVAVVKNNGVELIVAAMAKHQANPLICKTGCSALATVALRNPAHCKRIFENYGHQVVLQAMQIHKTDKAVQVHVYTLDIFYFASGSECGEYLYPYVSR